MESPNIFNLTAKIAGEDGPAGPGVEVQMLDLGSILRMMGKEVIENALDVSISEPNGDGLKSTRLSLEMAVAVFAGQVEPEKLAELIEKPGTTVAEFLPDLGISRVITLYEEDTAARFILAVRHMDVVLEWVQQHPEDLRYGDAIREEIASFMQIHKDAEGGYALFSKQPHIELMTEMDDQTRELYLDTFIKEPSQVFMIVCTSTSHPEEHAELNVGPHAIMSVKLHADWMSELTGEYPGCIIER